MVSVNLGKPGVYPADPNGRKDLWPAIYAQNFTDIQNVINNLDATYAPGLGTTRNSLTGWWHVDGNGAAGDGVTSDTAIVNAVIASASTAGRGVVYFTPGKNYAYSGSIQPRSGVILYSRGARFTKLSAGAIISSTIAVAGFSVDGIIFSGTVNEFPTDPKRTRTTSATGASAAVYLSGDLDTTGSGQGVIRDFTMRNCRMENMTSLPINIRGVRGVVRVTNNTFYNNQDVGFIFNEEVVFNNNSVYMSADNGVSLSRGNQKVVCVGNTFENCSYHGIWVSGFNTDLGPQNFTVAGNTVKNIGYNGIHCDSAPQNGNITGNTILQGYCRGPSDALSDSYSCGIWIGGYPTTNRSAPTNLATNINVTGNAIRGAAKYGVYITGGNAVRIGSNTIVDVGTQYFSDGATVIASTDTTSNVGIFFDQPSQSLSVVLQDNLVVDTRATPYCNYGVVPQVPTTGLGHVYDNNIMRGCRNGSNTQDSGLTRQINYQTQFLGGAIVRSKLGTGGTAPTVAAGAQSASVAVGSNSQNDVAGSINATAAASPVAGTIATVTFASVHTVVPHIILSAKDAATATTRLYPSSVSTTGFNISTSVAPTGGAVLAFDYLVID